MIYRIRMVGLSGVGDGDEGLGSCWFHVMWKIIFYYRIRMFAKISKIIQS